MKNKTKSVLAAFRSKFAAALPIILFFLFNPRIGGYNPVQGQLSEISNSPAADRSCGDAVFDGSSQLLTPPAHTMPAFHLAQHGTDTSGIRAKL